HCSRQSVARTGASPGSSTIADELSSTNPGDPISSSVAAAAASRPLALKTRKKNALRRNRVDATVSKRAASTEKERCAKMDLSRNVCNGGWSFQKSTYIL